jgi:hypothetical protein
VKWIETRTDNCTIQLTLDVVGEKWTLLILRDAFNGVRRFDDFRRHVGLSDPVLADRLRTLVRAGILTTRFPCSSRSSSGATDTCPSPRGRRWRSGMVRAEPRWTPWSGAVRITRS